MGAEMTLTQVAAAIDAHLRRFEADPAINVVQRTGQKRFFRAGAVQSGRFVYVTYISYQRQSHLTRTEAMRYLRALDRGYTGKHHADQLEVWESGSGG